jgi:hypothetical protein
MPAYAGGNSDFDESTGTYRSTGTAFPAVKGDPLRTPRQNFNFEETVLGVKGATIKVGGPSDEEKKKQEAIDKAALEKAGIILSVDPFGGQDNGEALSGANPYGSEAYYEAPSNWLTSFLGAAIDQMMIITPQGTPGAVLSLVGGPAGAAAAVAGRLVGGNPLSKMYSTISDLIHGKSDTPTLPTELDAPHSSSNNLTDELTQSLMGTDRSNALADELTQSLMGTNRGGRAAPRGPGARPAYYGDVEVSELGPVRGANLETLAELATESIDPGALGIGSYGGEANASNAANAADDVAAYGVDPTLGINPSFLAEGGKVQKLAVGGQVDPMAPAPPGAIPMPEMVAQEPGAAPPGATADDVPRQQEDGDFVLNSKAVELAGLPDISKMIQTAIDAARTKGIEVLPEAQPNSDPVDVLVSNGELIIPKGLVPFIGEEKLVKINNRGKKAMAQEEQAQQAQGGPPALPQQAPGGIPQPQVPGLAEGGAVPVPDMLKKEAFLRRIEEALKDPALHQKQAQITEAMGPKGEIDPNAARSIQQGATEEALSRTTGIFGSGTPGATQSQPQTGVPLGNEPTSAPSFFDRAVQKGRSVVEEVFRSGKQAPQNPIDNLSEVARLWDITYQDNKEDKAKLANATSRLQVYNKTGRYAPTVEASAAMDAAAYIFEGDAGFTKDQILDTLTAIGVIETGFETKVQTSGGPAKSFWQVEPKTAMSLLKNSGALFGPKFEKTFGGKYASPKGGAKETLAALGENQLSALLEQDNELAASFAMAKWISQTMARTLSGELKP